MEELTGQRFGRLVVLRLSETRRYGTVDWLCVCDCGNTTLATRHQLKTGAKKSCGCLKQERINRSKSITDRIMSGQRFGRLVVLHPAEERKYGMITWECKCDCGNLTLALERQLRSGSKKSCGCLQKDMASQRRKDHTTVVPGQQFGQLTAVYLTNERINGARAWECRCSCGNTTLATGYQLTSGSKKSCGCLLRIRAFQKRKDITGQRFGKLTAIRDTEERKHGSIVWECRCDCGATVMVAGTTLRSGKTRSCGCL